MLGRIESGPFQERDDAIINNNEPQEWAVEIAAQASLSDGVELGPYVLCGIVMPAAFTGTTLTFQSRSHGTVWTNVYDALGIELSATVAASRFVVLDPADFASCRWIRVRSGTAASPTAEDGDRAIVLIVRTV